MGFPREQTVHSGRLRPKAARTLQAELAPSPWRPHTWQLGAPGSSPSRCVTLPGVRGCVSSGSLVLAQAHLSWIHRVAVGRTPGAGLGVPRGSSAPPPFLYRASRGWFPALPFSPFARLTAEGRPPWLTGILRCSHY